MGQKSGDTGVKASLRRRFERAFGRHPNYDECLEELEQSPSQAAIVVDGNVLLRQLPKNVSREATDNLQPRNEPATLHDYVEILPTDSSASSAQPMWSSSSSTSRRR